MITLPDGRKIGKPKGWKPPLTKQEVADICARKKCNPVEFLCDVIKDPKAGRHLRVKAAGMLLPYIWRQKYHVEHGADAAMLAIIEQRLIEGRQYAAAWRAAHVPQVQALPVPGSEAETAPLTAEYTDAGYPDA